MGGAREDLSCGGSSHRGDPVDPYRKLGLGPHPSKIDVSDMRTKLVRQMKRGSNRDIPIPIDTLRTGGKGYFPIRSPLSHEDFDFFIGHMPISIFLYRNFARENERGLHLGPFSGRREQVCSTRFPNSRSLSLPVAWWPEVSMRWYGSFVFSG